MSHEINIHEAQSHILRELLFHTEAGFADLQKPTGLDSDHFKFHIARLVELKYVESFTSFVDVFANIFRLKKSNKSFFDILRH